VLHYLIYPSEPSTQGASVPTLEQVVVMQAQMLQTMQQNMVNMQQTLANMQQNQQAPQPQQRDKLGEF
jgi:hypothetical protein